MLQILHIHCRLGDLHNHTKSCENAREPILKSHMTLSVILCWIDHCINKDPPTHCQLIISLESPAFVAYTTTHQSSREIGSNLSSFARQEAKWISEYKYRLWFVVVHACLHLFIVESASGYVGRGGNKIKQTRREERKKNKNSKHSSYCLFVGGVDDVLRVYRPFQYKSTHCWRHWQCQLTV